jgi:hypothetical protein
MNNALSNQLFSNPRSFAWNPEQKDQLLEHLDKLSDCRPALNTETLVNVMGVPNGAKIEVMIEDDGSVTLVARASRIGLETLYTLVYLDNHQWQLALQDIRIHPEQQKKTMATVIFAHAFSAAAHLGFQSIRGFAMRSPNHDGYMVWPILGFDGLLDDTVDDMSSLQSIKSDLLGGGQSIRAINHLKTVQDLMALENGRALWAKHGYTLDMTFDLTPNSPSWEIFKAYLTRKGIALAEGWPS